jgi:hypothetical protein
MFDWKAASVRVALTGFLITLLVVATMAWCSERDKRRGAAGEATVATSQAKTGQIGAEKASDQQQAEAKGRELTEANTAYIEGAENADESAGDAGRRGQLVYCNRQRMRGKPLPDYCVGL